MRRFIRRLLRLLGVEWNTPEDLSYLPPGTPVGSHLEGDHRE